MYFQCPFNTNLFYDELKTDPNSGSLIVAFEYMESDRFTEAHNTISMMREDASLNGLVLSSLFSKEFEEEREFTIRHLEVMQTAANLRNKFALYSLGVYFDTGNYVDEDKDKACIYFRLAAELGMIQAMHIYGIMLYYGTGGAPYNREAGLDMVTTCAELGYRDSENFLDYLKENK